VKACDARLYASRGLSSRSRTRNAAHATAQPMGSSCGIGIVRMMRNPIAPREWRCDCRRLLAGPYRLRRLVESIATTFPPANRRASSSLPSCATTSNRPASAASKRACSRGSPEGPGMDREWTAGVRGALSGEIRSSRSALFSASPSIVGSRSGLPKALAASSTLAGGALVLRPEAKEDSRL
jgi:hypothetical protein